jgi:hypothetical protein
MLFRKRVRFVGQSDRGFWFVVVGLVLVGAGCFATVAVLADGRTHAIEFNHSIGTIDRSEGTIDRSEKTKDEAHEKYWVVYDVGPDTDVTSLRPEYIVTLAPGAFTSRSLYRIPDAWRDRLHIQEGGTLTLPPEYPQWSQPFLVDRDKIASSITMTGFHVGNTRYYRGVYLFQ